MFATPLWLYALATLAIPLALHLWSRRPRDLIRVGSLRHVADLAEARSWSARLTEPLLLLLRLGILACVVLALAGPRTGRAHLGDTVSRMVLVEPALLASPATIGADPLLDSLARSRATVRLLAPGLPRWQLDGANSGVGLQEEVSPGRVAIWDLLLEADRLVSRGGSLLVIARPRLVALGGRRPSLAARVEWHVPGGGAGETKWLAGRWPLAPDTILEVVGWGSPGGVGYRSRAVSADAVPRCCRKAAAVAVEVRADDSASRRRLRLAAVAAGTILGQSVNVSPPGGRPDLVLTTGQVTDSLFTGPGRVVTVSAASLRSRALADTVLAHWPSNPLAHDPEDPRQVSITQAMPNRGGLRPGRQEARSPLLLFALMLFAIERWLATRPVRRVT